MVAQTLPADDSFLENLIVFLKQEFQRFKDGSEFEFEVTAPPANWTRVLNVYHRSIHTGIVMRRPHHTDRWNREQLRLFSPRITPRGQLYKPSFTHPSTWGNRNYYVLSSLARAIRKYCRSQTDQELEVIKARQELRKLTDEQIDYYQQLRYREIDLKEELLRAYKQGRIKGTPEADKLMDTCDELNRKAEHLNLLLQNLRNFIEQREGGTQ